MNEMFHQMTWRFVWSAALLHLVSPLPLSYFQAQSNFAEKNIINLKMFNFENVVNSYCSEVVWFFMDAEKCFVKSLQGNGLKWNSFKCFQTDSHFWIFQLSIFTIFHLNWKTRKITKCTSSLLYKSMPCSYKILSKRQFDPQWCKLNWPNPDVRQDCQLELGVKSRSKFYKHRPMRTEMRWWVVSVIMHARLEFSWPTECLWA